VHALQTDSNSGPDIAETQIPEIAEVHILESL